MIFSTIAIKNRTNVCIDFSFEFLHFCKILKLFFLFLARMTDFLDEKVFLRIFRQMKNHRENQRRNQEYEYF